MVANTTETLLLGDLETLKLSEIPWQARGGGGSGGVGGGRGGDRSASAAAAEKFIFDSPSAALVYHASELSIIEYGRNEVRNAKGYGRQDVGAGERAGTGTYPFVGRLHHLTVEHASYPFRDGLPAVSSVP